MDARERQIKIRIVELAKRHPSFAKSIGVNTTLEEKHHAKREVKSEGNKKHEDAARFRNWRCAERRWRAF